MKYKIPSFGNNNGRISEGYLSLEVVSGMVEIDPSKSDQIRLIEAHNGKPIIVATAGKPKKTVKK